MSQSITTANVKTLPRYYFVQKSMIENAFLTVKNEEEKEDLFVWLVGFLTSSSTDRLYRGRRKRGRRR